MAELRGLLVDYGGVLTNPLSEFIGNWVRTDGVDPDRFAELMRRWLGPGAERNPIHDLETGTMDAAEFERLLAVELATDADPAQARRTAGMLTRMFSGMRVEPSMLGVLRTARAAGLRTGLLSNSWGLDYERDGWDTLFDAVVISGEVGLRKPDPAIYALAAERMELPPEQIVFVDDLRPNVRAAVAVGMVGVEHVDVSTTVDELEILLGRPLR
ncbi:MAG TPA: HAD family phosphatase [Mycobacteriales bacterium]|nr:HAD family phosphatase [Mycobacteriales bacterium]